VKHAVALAALALLTACNPRPDIRPGEAFADPSEKQVFFALKQVRASDEQRAAILAAWDESHPRAAELSRRNEELLAQWQGLDRRAPGFRASAAELSARIVEVARERMVLGAAFEERVAAALDEEQWVLWQDLGSGPGSGPRSEGGHQGGGRRRR
jgi:hypothetical protein